MLMSLSITHFRGNYRSLHHKKACSMSPHCPLTRQPCPKTGVSRSRPQSRSEQTTNKRRPRTNNLPMMPRSSIFKPEYLYLYPHTKHIKNTDQYHSSNRYFSLFDSLSLIFLVTINSLSVSLKLINGFC